MDEKPLMSYAEFAATLKEVETTFPINNWVASGLRIWPLIRLYIYWTCAISIPYAVKSRSRSQRLWDIARRESHILSNELKAHLFERKKNQHLRGNGTSEVVLLSDGVSFVKLDGAYYDRLCDPLEDYYRNQGVQTLKLTRHIPLLPRYAPSMLIGRQLQQIRARHLLQERIHGRQNHPAKGFAELCEFMHRCYGISLNWLHFEREAALVQHYSNFFEKKLRAAKARLGFVVNYYSDEGFAFCLACRRLGIPSVEVQHGVQGEFHAAYGNWNNLPIGGYDVLPSHFLVWSDTEAQAIRQWADRPDLMTKAIAAGNRFLSLCHADQLPALRESIAKIRQFVRPEATQVLYTLCYADDAQRLRPLCGTIRQSQSKTDIQWWIRLHPGGLSRLPEMKSCLQEAGVPAAQVDLATNLPLYAVLPQMHAHVTEASSTVIEAESFGVPSVVTNSWGVELFPSQVRSGMVEFADGADLLPRILCQVKSHCRASARYDASKSIAHNGQVLDELLYEARSLSLRQPNRRIVAA